MTDKKIGVAAILGRPNVGKSALFNRLAGLDKKRRASARALTGARPGITRDRLSARIVADGEVFEIADTGGVGGEEGALADAVARQARAAADCADYLLLVADARDGRLPADDALAAFIRRLNKPAALIVNKSEGLENAAADFYALGFADVFCVSAKRGDGIAALAAHLAAKLASGEEEKEEEKRRRRVAIVGRPNVGKSALINRMLRAERVIVSEVAGTTRDAVHLDFDFGGESYTLIDTAGLRRKKRAADAVEQAAGHQTRNALAMCDVALLIADANAGVLFQDKQIAALVIAAKRPAVLLANKADLLANAAARKRAVRDIALDLGFAEWGMAVHLTSAIAPRGLPLDKIFAAINAAFTDARRHFSTGKINRALAAAIARRAPPRQAGARPKLRYAHQGGENPPQIIIHGATPRQIPADYRRYLAREMRRELELKNAPLHLSFRQKHR